MSDKVTPTKAMIDLRKDVEKKRQEFQKKQSEYWQESNAEKAKLKKRRDKLSADRDLAAEAAIGYGLAIKAIEENIRAVDAELLDMETQLQAKAPQMNFGDDFKLEFGVSEYEIDWSKVKS